MQTSLDRELALLLSELVASQDQLLELLARKRQLLGAADAEGLTALAPRETQLLETFQALLRHREGLLARAASEGLPSSNLRALTAALPRDSRDVLQQQVAQAASRTRLLQNQSLVNWVVVQRTLLHLSQLLEIIATGGRLQPTYGERARVRTGGTLVDRAV
ncbi:MAG: flagellar export chaperone FlgN [Thermoguttaceae bacterium]|jgi:flagellar biosynthesis/type III secretory pathway chaperone